MLIVGLFYFKITDVFGPGMGIYGSTDVLIPEGSSLMWKVNVYKNILKYSMLDKEEL